MKKYFLTFCCILQTLYFWAQAPVVSISASNTQVCQGDTVLINVTSNEPSSTFLWSNGATTNSVFLSPNQSTTYTCVVTANGLSTVASQTITVITNPIADAGSDFTKTCVSNANGAFIGMIPQPGVTYSWTPALGLSASGVANPIANPVATTSYMLTATHTQSGCTATDAVTVIVDQQVPAADAGLDAQITCVQNNTGVQLGAMPTAGQTYNWTPSAGLSATGFANPIANPSTTTNYTLTVTNVATGCSSTDQVLITVNLSQPLVDAGNNFTKTCVQNSTGTNIGFNGQNSVAYLWSPTNGLTSINTSLTNANPSVTTTYTLTATHVVSGCSASDQVVVTVDVELPIVDAGNDFTKTCLQNQSGAQIGMTAVTGVSYEWSPTIGLSPSNTSNPIANPSTNQTYTLIATDLSSGCISSDQINISVNNVPPSATAGADFSKTCILNPNGLQIGSNALTGLVYSWFPTSGLSNPNVSNPIANPTQSISYQLTVTDPINGCTASDQVSVSVNTSVPYANAGSDFTKTCVSNLNGAFIGMTSQPGVTYSWSPTSGLISAISANPTANPSTTTTYTLTANHSQSGCSASDAVTVTVDQQIPIADAGLDAEKTCVINNTGVQIGSLPTLGQTYNWTPSTGLSATSLANPIANPSNTTNYTLTVTNVATGCSATDQVLVNVNTLLPTANAGADFTKTCVQNTNGLNIGQIAISGVSYNWSPSLGLSSVNISNPNANPNVTTTYTLTATQLSSGCTASDQIIVSVNDQVPLANAGLDLLKTCSQNANGAYIGAASQNSCTYSWSPVQGLSTPSSSSTFANPNQTTIYTLTVTHNSSGCTATDQMTIEVNVTPPTVNAGNDFIKTCLQNPNGLEIGSSSLAGFSYAWFPTLGLSNPFISNPVANPTQSTSYLLTVTDQINGCSATDQVAVTVNTTPPTANAGSDFTKTCVSNINGLLLGAGTTAGLTYSWSPAIGLSSSTISNPLANPSVTTTYTLTVTSVATGCSNTDMVTVNVNQTAPLAQAGPDFLKNCFQNLTGNTIGMPPISGNSYQWNPISGINLPTASNPIANPAFTTTYTLTVTDALNGCVSTDQIIVTVDISAPTANAGNDFAINCFGNPNGSQIGMSQTPGITYSWLPATGLSNSFASSTLANPSQTTTYTLTALNPTNGCQTSDQVLVNVNLSTPIANAGPDLLKNCITHTNGAQIGSIAQTQTNYSWTPSLTLSSPNAAQTWANPTQSTWYVLTATNWESGCSDIDSVYFEVNNMAPIIDAGYNQSICLGDSIIVSGAYPTGTQISWNNGIQNNQYFIPIVSQYYTLTVIASNGCQSQDSLFVQVNALPGIYAGQDIEICEGETITLAGSFGSIYYWSGGISNGVPFIPQTSGVYTVTGIDTNGCQNNDLVIVTVHPNPVVFAGSNPAICLGDSVLLAASGAFSYTWSNGMSNGAYITPNYNTLLEVTGTDQFGCTGSDLLDITVIQPTNSTINVVFQGPYTLNGVTYDVSGTYIQVIPNSAGCDSTITLNYELVDVGIDELYFAQIEAFPNPFTNEIWMSYEQVLVGTQLFVLDLSGRIVSNYELNADLKMLIDLSHLPPGAYLINSPHTQPLKIIKL
jgi:hypothetical protein